MTYGIHWFRRDLRVAGNLALQKQWKLCSGKVVGLFCFDAKFLARSDFSVDRFQFFLHTLKELKEELVDLGSDLLFLDVGPLDGLAHLLEILRKSGGALPSYFSWNRDYEPFAKQRDAAVKDYLESQGIQCHTQRDHLLIEPKELERPQGEGYQVYTPFARKWLSLFQEDFIQARIKSQKSGLQYLQSRHNRKSIKTAFSLQWKDLLAEEECNHFLLEKYIKQNSSRVSVAMPKAGSLAAYEQLLSFQSSLKNYANNRDFPSQQGTSRLSLYLKNGSLTVAQIIYAYQLTSYDVSQKSRSEDVFFSEIIWREFYYHILDRHPRVEKESFQLKYRNLAWENSSQLFEAWKEGKTGFPIVDAGMRELKQTGWMHNRVRMIVASFLTKDLLIDWRWGEQYFMEKLLDGDLAPNNGGWQWAASTGCDPQPYFRIFNPWTQSKKFDPDGEYIKKYIPELRDLPAARLHQPIRDHSSYPSPIVDHDIQRKKALKLYS